MDKKVKLSVLSIFLAAALIGSLIAYGENMAYAGEGKKSKKSNEAVQILEQSSSTGQDSSCFSENGTIKASCNNLAFSLGLNDGNNAKGQQ
jgi:hypothetical protein